MANILYSGNSVGLVVQMKTNGVNDPVDNGATVTAAIIDSSAALLAGPWSCSSGTTGADWPAGLVIVPVSGADTTAAFTGGRTAPFHGCRLEIKVTEGATTLTRRTTQTFSLYKAVI